jgi:hypothetical protein
MGVLKFSDGVQINTNGPIRSLELHDGWYVVGEGMCIPVRDEIEANKLVTELTT